MSGQPDNRGSDRLPGEPAPRRVATDGGAAAVESRPLALEAPVTVDIHEVGSFTIMASPDNALALAAGFALAEGIIQGRDDIMLAQVCPEDPGVVRLRVRQPAATQRLRRNLVITSSCGLCGGENLDRFIADLPRVEARLRVRAAVLGEVVERLRERQGTYRLTGATHGAGLFDQDGRIHSLAEDVGRHNALDKSIGMHLLAGRSFAGLGAVLSGRVSLEMVVKCARAGAELIAAVSAPTSLAVEAAEACGVTLCAFVRQGGASVYTHPGRVLELSSGG